MTNEKDREDALRLSDALEKTSLQAIGLKMDNLTDEQLALYKKRRALEIESWIGVIIENNLRIRSEAVKAERGRIGRELAEISIERRVSGKRRMILEIEMTDLSAILADKKEPYRG